MSEGGLPIARRTAGEDAALPASLHPVLRRVYAARGIRTAEELELGLRHLAPVGGLANLDRAVELLLAHRGGRVTIVGDFDADGATSTALVLRCLGRYGFAAVDSLVPNRFDFGYGLTPEIVEVAAEAGPSLIVTVDNGISSVRGVERARELGIDVLVTDHHLPGERLPAAAAIVNPNLPGDPYPSKYLAGVGVAFCVMAALGRRLAAEGQNGAERIAADYLDLVALGTVADVVPLDRNNRVLVRQGLARIRAGAAVPGIPALLQAAGRDPRRAVASDLAFGVAPRLNAAGRLEDMSTGIEALVSDSVGEVRALAARLSEINDERRRIEARMQAEALSSLEDIELPEGESALPHCVTLYDPGWHQGVVGLVASRIRERVNRPVIAFADAGGGELKGSARSVPGVHIRDVLAAVAASAPEMIGRYGGHAMAAGLSLPRSNLERFRRLAASRVAECFPDADFSGTLLTDGELDAADIGLPLAEALREAGPWGQAFPEPLFDGVFTVREARVVGERHWKLRLTGSGAGAPVDAIAFNQVDTVTVMPGHRVHVAYRLDVNEYGGIRRAQLVVEGMQRL
ncbi:single-stranded-DNA-specific exonuclease RecJ [Lentisalinibacter salinarum]|uniref:single-stranded-DNA-specific exonuclease RecJ n=1 Tax=Lentisalinibacter salinarum TaxID=2992239 RepID=UPI00386CDB7B